jgi:hypothetical protein
MRASASFSRNSNRDQDVYIGLTRDSAQQDMTRRAHAFEQEIIKAKIAKNDGEQAEKRELGNTAQYHRHEVNALEQRMIYEIREAVQMKERDTQVEFQRLDLKERDASDRFFNQKRYEYEDRMRMRLAKRAEYEEKMRVKQQERSAYEEEMRAKEWDTRYYEEAVRDQFTRFERQSERDAQNVAHINFTSIEASVNLQAELSQTR